MKSAKQARMETNQNLQSRCKIVTKQKILDKNKDKLYFIVLPYKLRFVEMLIEDAIEKGLNYCKINNEITPETEECLIENGYKVVWYKNFIKVSW